MVRDSERERHAAEVTCLVERPGSQQGSEELTCSHISSRHAKVEQNLSRELSSPQEQRARPSFSNVNAT